MELPFALIPSPLSRGWFQWFYTLPLYIKNILENIDFSLKQFLCLQICGPGGPESRFGLVYVISIRKSLGVTFQGPPRLRTQGIFELVFLGGNLWISIFRLKCSIPSGTAVRRSVTSKGNLFFPFFLVFMS